MIPWIALIWIIALFDHKEVSPWQRFWAWVVGLIVTLLLGLGLWKLIEGVVWLVKHVNISIG